MPTWWERLLHVAVGRVGRHDDLPDLRKLPSSPVSVGRTHYVVHDREREKTGDRLYVLRREPRDRRHPEDIAVYANGRGVGYLPDGAAAALAPLLDRLGGAAVVNGTGSSRAGSIRLRVEVPDAEALRGFVAAYESAAEAEPQR